MPKFPVKNLENLVTPVKSYSNSLLEKKFVFENNNKKAGIYRWTNKLKAKSYIGSGVDLTKRLRYYYNLKELKTTSRPIDSALIKYGHDNFSLEILEYCNKEDLSKREQYYFDLLDPEYNILKEAYSLTGFKHSEETIRKLKEKVISPEHKVLLSSIHSDKVVTEDVRLKLSNATKKFKENNPLTVEAIANLRSKTIEREGVAVSVLNTLTDEVKIFTNQTEAGLFLNITRQGVYNALKRGSLVNNKYKITKI